MEDQSNLERIVQMEAYMDECTAAVNDLLPRLERLDDLRQKMTALFQYYGSPAWYADRDGKLPPGTLAGVLTEDAVYDLITDTRDVAFHMLETATDVLKNRL